MTSTQRLYLILALIAIIAGGLGSAIALHIALAPALARLRRTSLSGTCKASQCPISLSCTASNRW